MHSLNSTTSIKTKTSLFILFLILISITYSKTKEIKNSKNTITTFLQVNPNDLSTFPKEEISELEKISNEKTEEIIGTKTNLPYFTFITTGYLTISTIKNVIIYPFSAKENIINVYYKNGFMLLKDNNDMIIWNYKFDSNEENEINALTFINRGTLIIKDSSNDRIWPFSEENLYKKININYHKGNLNVTKEQNEKLWEKNIEKENNDKDLNLKTQVEYIAI
jgi:hypothetical protein